MDYCVLCKDEATLICFLFKMYNNVLEAQNYTAVLKRYILYTGQSSCDLAVVLLAHICSLNVCYLALFLIKWPVIDALELLSLCTADSTC